jgi:dynein intermediate chain 1
MERNEVISQLTVHFSLDSNSVLCDSDEHKLQEEIMEERLKGIREVAKQHELVGLKGLSSIQDNDDNVRLARKIQRNKFNYSEMGTQSRPKTILERAVSTSRPNLLKFSCEVNQAAIYKAYLAQAAEGAPEKLKELKLTVPDDPKNPPNKLVGDFSEAFHKELMIMERMIVQNNHEDKFNDYKYMFTNAAAAKKTDERIYPLWRFWYDQIKLCNVTSVKWNPKYPDLFAIALGSYQFGKKPSTTGICLFSVKNPSFPERIWPLTENVLSLDFSQTNPSFLAAGLSNGNVMVIDIKRTDRTPIYMSSLKTKKHADAVWEVHWNTATSKLSFNSISADGKVFQWTLGKDRLECEEVFRLKYTDKKNKGGDQEESPLNALASGLCFDFSPFDKFLFLVGTEEGALHLCSSAYSGEYQYTFDGHQLAVYRVRFSPYNSDVFLSASADWSVKIWRLNCKAAVMTFDLGQAIVDIGWSPFSSSVFICLSLDKLHVFDLGANRYEPVAEINPVDRKCTNLAINWKEPTVLVGDSHGGVSSFKLCKALANQEAEITSAEFKQKQIAHLKNCMVLGSMID